MSSFSESAALFLFYNQKPEIALSKTKSAEFYCHNFIKVFKISKNANTLLNFSYLAVKLPSFKPVGAKLSKLEPRVFHRFDINIVSGK